MSQKNKLKKLMEKKGIESINVDGTPTPVQSAKELDLIEAAKANGIM